VHAREPGDGPQLGRILVVEDERIVALDLVRTLEDLGYAVVGSVATGEAAIARVTETAPDIVLMDIRLAGALDGIGAADWIRKNRGVPVIFLTAHADDETLRRAKQTAPSGYLTKPFRATDLRCAIEIALHKQEIDDRLRERERWLATTLRSAKDDEDDGGDDGARSPRSGPVAEALFGWPHDEDLGRRLGDIMRLVGHGHDGDAPAAIAPGSPGEPSLIATLNTEIEQRVGERTAQLEAANRELDAFSASVAHDLRAPLRHIDGFSQILIEDHTANLGADGVALLRRVRTATSQMTQLIEDMLRLSRVGSAPLSRSRVDLSAMARAILAGQPASPPGRAPAISIEDHLEADGDPGLLQIALQNLLGNAWKFTSHAPQPEIVVGAREDRGERAIFVRDNGAGFDAAGADKLFGAFQRFHSAREFEGNGMGLAIVERIVKRHGGRIWADSRPGAGATFFFVI
jgi:signal transduction histidine kinase/AmiR/NasT family two-component response regulator